MAFLASRVAARRLSSKPNSITPIPEVSVIIPVNNGANWINGCLQSILEQSVIPHMPVEISVFNDASTDSTESTLQAWEKRLKPNPNVSFVLSHGLERPRGVGYAKNRAVEQSRGRFLCFQDIDDVMLPDRIHHQYAMAIKNENAIVGSQFERIPADSTARYTRWANSLSPEKLTLQVYTSHGPTIIMPTWFMSRNVFDRVGGFSEAGQGTPEDLIFFYKHLDIGGSILRVNENLLLYRYHPHATTFSVHEDTIWDLRVKRLQEVELKRWESFTIWNAGKQGRKLYKSLEPFFQERVLAFCDVDAKKIGQSYKPHFPNDRVASTSSRSVPILSYEQAKPPFIICVKLDMTAGDFEKTLRSLALKEGHDYIIFS